MMRSTHTFLSKRIRKTKPAELPAESIDFTPLSDTAKSITVTPIRIKRPSRVLPSDHVTNKIDAFRMGAKRGTGSKMFYGVIPGIKEVIGLSPATKKGKLVDAINQMRNDARTLNKNIQNLCDQFDRVMSDTELSHELKQQAALMALYFLEKSLNKLPQILSDLKTYMGLLKGNAIVGLSGFIVAGKEPLEEKHPHLSMKEREKDIELQLLQELAADASILQSAMHQLEELELSVDDFQRWKQLNRVKIEESLNTNMGAGSITGIAIQGAIFSAINFGIAAATLNPVIFAAGAYYATSAVVRIGEVAVKTRLQNNIIRETLSETPTVSPVSSKFAQHQSRIKIVDGVGKIHNAVDTLANTGFMASATAFQLIVTTDRPRLIAEEHTTSTSFSP